MKRTQEDLNELLQKAINQVKSVGIVPSDKISPNVEILNSASTYARCDINTLTRKCTISISKYTRDIEEKFLMDSLVHEVLHSVSGCSNHGDLWKYNASIVNEAFGYNIKRLSNGDKEGWATEEHKAVLQKYVVICPNCGTKFYRQRMCKLVKNPENYRCGKCKTPLERIK